LSGGTAPAAHETTHRALRGCCVGVRAVAQLQGILAHDTEADLPRIRVPALVVHGDEDQVVPVENGRRLAAKLPNARLLILPRTGHLYVWRRKS